MESHVAFVAGFFHLAQCCQSSLMLSMYQHSTAFDGWRILIYLYTYIVMPPLLIPSSDGHLDSFDTLAIENVASVNIPMWICSHLS